MHCWIFNKRRLEDTTYSLWNHVLVSLVKNNSDLYLVNPQYYIYKSSPMLIGGDPNTSAQTTTDAGARGVAVDHCVGWYRLLERVSPVLRRLRSNPLGPDLSKSS